jgi:hypothetical protein
VCVLPINNIWLFKNHLPFHFTEDAIDHLPKENYDGDYGDVTTTPMVTEKILFFILGISLL